MAACRFAKNNTAAEHNAYSRLDRCLDGKCRVCRYVRDENDKVVEFEKDGEIKKLGAKCTECPRAGWVAGNRENCCVRHICNADCTRCPFPKEGHAPYSAEASEDEGYPLEDKSDFTAIIEDRLTLDQLFSRFNAADREVMNAVRNGQDLMGIAKERHAENPDKKLKSVHRGVLRDRDRIIAK
ncbi:hypothetical protein FACS1894188_02100 [Clostridia bacterium]|nr:hypothetical protein FACS1894188_02100 [Clostridia bacterium]